jgi:hypothetical protein
MANREKLGLEVVYQDADIESADWTKQTWDLPPTSRPNFSSGFLTLRSSVSCRYMPTR